jgi:two-component system, NtrC family, response regulator GlrR
MDKPTLIGKSCLHLELLERIKKIAPTEVEVLITGPTGSGKELYAHHLHGLSARKDRKFVAINCGAIPLELFENEMFGHVGGAYTGAQSSSEGLVSEADGGTLFLDEIDSLVLPAQVKLLRFLQQKEFRRLGNSRIHRADVRVVAAANSDLRAAVQKGIFREDLYYRLRVAPVEVPPLRARPEDIPLLIDEYADRFSDAYQLPRVTLAPRTLETMLSYSWPGNIRELENCMKYLTCLQLARAVDKYDLPFPDLHPQARRATDKNLTDQRFTEARDALVSDFEKRYVIEALRKTNGNITQAAEEAGEYRKKIARLIKKHGIDRVQVVPEAAPAIDPAKPGAA